jgi:chromosomal replication initiator protein
MEAILISGELADKFRKWLASGEVQVRNFEEMPKADNITMRKIKRTVRNKYLDGEEFKRCNDRDQVRAQRIAMYLARKLTEYSLPRIGREFGRHHTTVLDAHQKIGEQMVDDPKFAAEMKELQTLIEGWY